MQSCAERMRTDAPEAVDGNLHLRLSHSVDGGSLGREARRESVRCALDTLTFARVLSQSAETFFSRATPKKLSFFFG